MEKCLGKGAISVRGGRQFFMVQVAVTGWGSRYRSGAAPSWRDSPGGQRPSLPGQQGREWLAGSNSALPA